LWFLIHLCAPIAQKQRFCKKRKIGDCNKFYYLFAG
jgi:hypothetical protein